MVYIRSEDDAWNYLRRYLSGENLPRPILDGWPIMKIMIKGEDYQSSITASQMEAYISFQSSISRAYAAMAHGHFDARYLKDEEAADLNLRTEVQQGSSILETDLSPLIQALSSTLSRSNPTEVIVGAVLICLFLTAPSIVKRIFEGRSEILKAKGQNLVIEALISKTHADSKRLETFDAALASVSAKFPALAGALPSMSNAVMKLVRSLQDADTTTINGIDVSSEAVEALTQRKPRASKNPETYIGDLLITSMQRKQNHYLLGLVGEAVAFSAKIYLAHQSEEKLGTLLVAFQKSKPVNFTLLVTNPRATTPKAVVELFKGNF